MIARYLDYEFTQSMTRNFFYLKMLKSQNSLMGIIVISRLMQFLSFDVISYAAGLTSLYYWRFALVTLLEILSASFTLAYVGTEMGSGALHCLPQTERAEQPALRTGFVDENHPAVFHYRHDYSRGAAGAR